MNAHGMYMGSSVPAYHPLSHVKILNSCFPFLIISVLESF